MKRLIGLLALLFALAGIATPAFACPSLTMLPTPKSARPLPMRSCAPCRRIEAELSYGICAHFCVAIEADRADGSVVRSMDKNDQ